MVILRLGLGAVALACCLFLAQAGQAPTYPVVTNPPAWSWDSLGSMSFAHTGQSQPYSASNLELLAKFPMVQFDKKQNIKTMPKADAEDRFIAAARDVRAAHTSSPVQILMYLNGLINFPEFHHLYNATKADPSLLLRDSQGNPLHIRSNTVFDVRQEAMRNHFVQAALYGMSSGVFNGVFVDRANWGEKCPWSNATCTSLVAGQRQLLSELSAALGEGNLTLAKETGDAPMMDWEVVNAAMTSDTFCSQYCHDCNTSVSPASLWTKSDYEGCAQSIATIANMSARGQLTQSHAMGPFTGPYADEARQFTMAAFLIGAGNLSYFSYANWANACWTLAGTRWWPEYDLPLGAPTSPPNTKLAGKRWKYFRNFSSGTTVYVDVATRVVDIQWGPH